MGGKGSREAWHDHSHSNCEPCDLVGNGDQDLTPAVKEIHTSFLFSQSSGENTAAVGVHSSDAGNDASEQNGTGSISLSFALQSDTVWPASDVIRSLPLPHPVKSPLLSVPSYSSELMATSPVTPMLLSYHRHSFSQSSGGMMGSLASSTSSPVVPLIHTRFLEINGYPAGLGNHGNICYCNAVLQLLYHCSPLRLRLLELHEIFANKKGSISVKKNTLLLHVADLFAKMHKVNNSKKMQRVVVSPKKLLSRVRRLNPMFDNDLQHDAHEFAIFMLNNMIETEMQLMADATNGVLSLDEKSGKKLKWKNMWRRRRLGRHNERSPATPISHLELQAETLELPPALRDASKSGTPRRTSSGTNKDTLEVRSATNVIVPQERVHLSPLQMILGGQFASLTACLECERVAVMREAFTDLSLDIQQGSSLRRCVENFGAPELFHGENKLYCNGCKKRVVAQKIIRVHRLPEYVLLVHLKRFQYEEKSGEMTKKSVHVALPREIDIVEYEPLDSCNDCGGDTNKDEVAGNDDNGGVSDETVDNSTAQLPPSLSSSSLSASSHADAADGTPKPSEQLMKRLDGVARRKGRFALSGFVTHVGRSPNVGHYFTCVRHGEQWRRFDDTTVTELSESEMRQYWGVPIPANGAVTATAYILLYERVA